MRSIAILAAALLLSCSSNSGSSNTENPKTPVKHGLTLFLTAEIQGTTEPCGCTADPLGDLARTAQLIAEARSQGPVLVFDGGSTLYTQVKVSDTSHSQEQMKSALIEKTLVEVLRVDAIGLGPYDLGEGVAKVRPARQAANLPSDSGIALAAPKVLDAGGMKVGVFGLVSPTALSSHGLKASDPQVAAKKAVADFKNKGAEVIVLLAQMTQAEAKALVQAVPGMDFVLVSQNLPEPADVRDAAMQVGTTWLFSPANRGQVISRLRLTRREAGSFADAVGEVRAGFEITRTETEIAALDINLAKWSKDPTADKAFVAAKQKEREELATQKLALKNSPLQAPASGNYFTLAQIRISKELDCQPEIVAAKKEYDKTAGEANVKAGADIKPEAVAKGEASYVGMEECEDCHQDAVDFWQKTHHAKAWQTLEKAGKEFDFDCIACHTTGFNKPGGSNIGFNSGLRNIQCEQCHGPGSIHVDAELSDKASTIRRDPPSTVCLECHTEEHSDTFEFDAYLRDIVGEGHGTDRRKALGEGDTGLKLRQDALQKAGLSIGKNCPK